MKYMAQPGAPPAAWLGPSFKQHQAKTIQQTASNTKIQTLPHPAVLLKIYIYRCLNQVQSSRRLEREAQRNVELMWLTGRLAPDFKTIADFRKDHADAIRKVCREFVLLCRRLKLFADGVIAIDGSKFKPVNSRDKNFRSRKIEVRMQQLEHSISCYLAELDRAYRDPATVLPERVARLKAKVAKIKEQMRDVAEIQKQLEASQDTQISLTDPDARSMPTSRLGSAVVGYNVQTAVDAKHHLMRRARGDQLSEGIVVQ